MVASSELSVVPVRWVTAGQPGSESSIAEPIQDREVGVQMSLKEATVFLQAAYPQAIPESLLNSTERMLLFGSEDSPTPDPNTALILRYRYTHPHLTDEQCFHWLKTYALRWVVSVVARFENQDEYQYNLAPTSQPEFLLTPREAMAYIHKAFPEVRPGVVLSKEEMHAFVTLAERFIEFQRQHPQVNQPDALRLAVIRRLLRAVQFFNI